MKARIIQQSCTINTFFTLKSSQKVKYNNICVHPKVQKGKLKFHVISKETWWSKSGAYLWTLSIAISYLFCDTQNKLVNIYDWLCIQIEHLFCTIMTVSLVMLIDRGDNLTDHMRTDLFTKCFYTVLGIVKIRSNCSRISLLTCFACEFTF